MSKVENCVLRGQVIFVCLSVLNISNFKLVTSQIPAILSSLEIDDVEVFGHQKSRQVHRHGTQFNVILKSFCDRGRRN